MKENEEEKMGEVKNVWKNNPELLQPFPKYKQDKENKGNKNDEEDKPDESQDSRYNLFSKAIKIAFDFNSDRLFYLFMNRDLLWMPDDPDTTLNVFQYCSSMKISNREPMISTWSYLFDNSDPYYFESYNRSEEEKKLLNEFYNYIKNKYKNGEEYYNRVNSVLFNDDDTYINYIYKINKKIFNSIKTEKYS